MQPNREPNLRGFALETFPEWVYSGWTVGRNLFIFSFSSMVTKLGFHVSLAGQARDCTICVADAFAVSRTSWMCKCLRCSPWLWADENVGLWSARASASHLKIDRRISLESLLLSSTLWNAGVFKEHYLQMFLRCYPWLWADKKLDWWSVRASGSHPKILRKTSRESLLSSFSVLFEMPEVSNKLLFITQANALLDHWDSTPTMHLVLRLMCLACPPLAEISK